MYRYDEFDHTIVRERVDQFREQVGRRLSGNITEDEFKPLRLMNGLYLQLHAYMLRVAIPYGTLSSRQMRALAHVARAYDKGYGHFTTRQNIQYNWPKLVEVPDLLDQLAKVEMHALQTSGNCIRNVTADPYAGVAADEIEDPRIYAEIIRQWSTLHPEFTFLPRKFKIAVTGAETDRAAVKLHDIGIAMVRADNGAVGFRIDVGGGQGRTPIIAETVREFLPKQDLLTFLAPTTCLAGVTISTRHASRYWFSPRVWSVSQRWSKMSSPTSKVRRSICRRQRLTVSAPISPHPVTKHWTMCLKNWKTRAQRMTNSQAG
jgi:sulfite reductase (NADPH) hemoprotein beta-component